MVEPYEREIQDTPSPSHTSNHIPRLLDFSAVGEQEENSFCCHETIQNRVFKKQDVLAVCDTDEQKKNTGNNATNGINLQTPTYRL